jgi:hypothetical protein
VADFNGIVKRAKDSEKRGKGEGGRGNNYKAYMYFAACGFAKSQIPASDCKTQLICVKWTF